MTICVQAQFIVLQLITRANRMSHQFSFIIVTLIEVFVPLDCVCVGLDQ